MRASGFRPSAAAFLAVITITAAAPSLMPEALPAVTPPALSKAGRRPARASALVLLLMNSSVSNTSGSPFFCGMLTRHDLVLELAGVLRGRGLLLAGQRQRVLHFAGDAVLLGHVLGGDAHVVLVVDVPQAVDDHGVDHLPVAHALAVAQPLQHVRRGAHVFLAAGDHDLAVARGHGLRGQHHGLQARAADGVDGQRRDFLGQAGLDQRLARRVLADAGGQHLAHDDFTDLVGRQPGALQQLP